ncbi:maf protein [Thermovibrio ammonificans HB-1]|uniref:dTTP/UTP pyrophosphatase n=1 Tax=Thermovibrio ammonificans (strain DSM 15698 / JCM 12110 / HB-1) TaxID=648996 RepID=E8T601_THEA1|nr:Maf family protein [Thermovibrio ammonificans]ADU96585.1 maf protein [Thermovibrio ammonificans HB-1]
MVEKVKLALVSSSPRRREILQMAGFNFRVVKVSVEEELHPSSYKTATLNAEKKVLAAKEQLLPGEVALAADTIVVLGDEILGKPKNSQEARLYLKRLSGRWHKVITGFSLLINGRVVTDYEESLVKFKRLTPSEIEWYISTGEPLDKAGAYGIQGKGALFIERIDGDFFTVMGLPVSRIYDILTVELE